MAEKAATQGAPGFGQVVTKDMGDKYTICQAGGSSGPNAQFPDTQIVFQANSDKGRSWKQGTDFSAFVFFTRTNQGAYPIVSATITRPQ
jgi:hypothetical protein